MVYGGFSLTFGFASRSCEILGYIDAVVTMLLTFRVYQWYSCTVPPRYPQSGGLIYTYVRLLLIVRYATYAATSYLGNIHDTLENTYLRTDFQLYSDSHTLSYMEGGLTH
eukprot:jgi/Botrbrau1/22189/Bobra.168_1s0021.1